MGFNEIIISLIGGMGGSLVAVLVALKIYKKEKKDLIAQRRKETVERMVDKAVDTILSLNIILNAQPFENDLLKDLNNSGSLSELNRITLDKNVELAILLSKLDVLSRTIYNSAGSVINKKSLETMHNNIETYIKNVEQFITNDLNDNTIINNLEKLDNESDIILNHLQRINLESLEIKLTKVSKVEKTGDSK